MLKKLVVMAALVFSLTSGMGTFCTVDNYGNMQCYYYTATQCQQACAYSSSCMGCVVRSGN